ncbi:MAG: hypothetical protein IT580_05945 [Verrucomicrobiales bacterium]|nr:hypothetical protein [Verrucomicrobiales bacterium]
MRAIDRRSFLFGIVASAGVIAGVWLWRRPRGSPDPMARVAPFVRPRERWSGIQFYEFLRALPEEAMLKLKRGVDLLPKDATTADLKGSRQDARDMEQQAVWVSSNVLEYPTATKENIDYHKIVQWICGRLDFEGGLIDSAPTFRLERELLNNLFTRLWEKLDEQQRLELLEKIDAHDQIKDKAAVAALGGAGALAALSTTVALTGFAFYTTLSSTIAAAAGAVGATFSFGVYEGAASTVAVLSGPIGLTIMAFAAIGGIALAGRADVQKTARLAALVHGLKVEALAAVGMTPEDALKS